MRICSFTSFSVPWCFKWFCIRHHGFCIENMPCTRPEENRFHVLFATWTVINTAAVAVCDFELDVSHSFRIIISYSFRKTDTLIWNTINIEWHNSRHIKITFEIWYYIGRNQMLKNCPPISRVLLNLEYFKMPIQIYTSICTHLRDYLSLFVKKEENRCVVCYGLLLRCYAWLDFRLLHLKHFS